MTTQPFGGWYASLHVGPMGKVQVSRRLRNADSIGLPEHVLRLAQREYENHFGDDQDYERMQERGGLSVLEVIGLLADLAERHGATPTPPRAAS